MAYETSLLRLMKTLNTALNVYGISNEERSTVALTIHMNYYRFSILYFIICIVWSSLSHFDLKSVIKKNRLGPCDATSTKLVTLGLLNMTLMMCEDPRFYSTLSLLATWQPHVTYLNWNCIMSHTSLQYIILVARELARLVDRFVVYFLRVSTRGKVFTRDNL